MTDCDLKGRPHSISVFRSWIYHQLKFIDRLFLDNTGYFSRETITSQKSSASFNSPYKLYIIIKLFDFCAKRTECWADSRSERRRSYEKLYGHNRDNFVWLLVVHPLVPEGQFNDFLLNTSLFIGILLLSDRLSSS